jgi:radical SAM superfamily enzyme YgiQ (UPF0313 family)
MDEIDVLVVRPPRFYTDVATSPIFPEEILPPTILEENNITSRFFNADFLPLKLRIFPYIKISDYFHYEEKLKEFLKGKSLEWKNAKRVVKKVNPKIVLLVLRMPSDFSVTLKMANIIKDTNEEIKVGFYREGNENFQRYISSKFLKSNLIDFGIIGEPEYTLLEVAKTVLKGKDISKIRGLAFKKWGKIIFTKRRPVEKDLDKFPIANRDLVLYRKYLPPSSFSVIEGGRGCIYSCNFCLAAGVPFRLRSPEKVIGELAQVYLKYGTRKFSFPMSSFLHSRKWALKICNLIKKFRLNITFSCYANLNQLDKKILKVLKSAGCSTLIIGLESGNYNTLIKMNKLSNLGFDYRNMREVARILKNTGIFLRIGIIINNPEESLNEIKDSLKTLHYFAPNPFRVQFLVPFPGTKYFKEIKKKRMLIDENLDLYHTGRINVKPYVDERILRKIWIKYARLSDLCEWVCFRKKILDRRIFLCKATEYFKYATQFFSTYVISLEE